MKEIDTPRNKILDEKVGKGLEFHDLVFNQIERVNKAANEGRDQFINSVEVLDQLLEMAGKDDLYLEEYAIWEKKQAVQLGSARNAKPGSLSMSERRRLLFSAALSRYGMLMRLVKRKIGPRRHVIMEV